MTQEKKMLLPEIYQTQRGSLELHKDATANIWATQKQIADIFAIERSVVTKHIGNLFKIGEIDKKSNVQKMHITNVDKPSAIYSLDVILAVGYRANSVKAIAFRQWATKVLHAHIVDGYTINSIRISKNYESFMEAVRKVKALLPPGDVFDADNVLELVSLFAGTWFSLDAYDKDQLEVKGRTKKQVALTSSALGKALEILKTQLLKRGEATELFGGERTKDAVEGIVGNVMQSFGGKDVYPTVEEKAAHLLYFMVKNHPFTDGNKRSGAFSFIWFLRKANILNVARMSPEALTALTLLVAESNPKEKEKTIRLITLLLGK